MTQNSNILFIYKQSKLLIDQNHPHQEQWLNNIDKIPSQAARNPYLMRCQDRPCQGNLKGSGEGSGEADVGKIHGNMKTLKMMIWKRHYSFQLGEIFGMSMVSVVHSNNLGKELGDDL